MRGWVDLDGSGSGGSVAADAIADKVGVIGLGGSHPRHSVMASAAIIAAGIFACWARADHHMGYRAHWRTSVVAICAKLAAYICMFKVGRCECRGGVAIATSVKSGRRVRRRCGHVSGGGRAGLDPGVLAIMAGLAGRGRHCGVTVVERCFGRFPSHASGGVAGIASVARRHVCAKLIADGYVAQTQQRGAVVAVDAGF